MFLKLTSSEYGLKKEGKLFLLSLELEEKRQKTARWLLGNSHNKK